MMLQELISSFLSLFSALTLDAPELSRSINDRGSPLRRPRCSRREDETDSACPSFEEEQLLLVTGYAELGSELENRPTRVHSLLKSLKVTIAITLATLPLVLTGIALIYFDLRTTDLCSEWKGKNYTLYSDVRRIKLFGKGVEIFTTHLVVSFIFLVLFGWNDFKRHYSSTIVIGVLFGLIHMLYSSFFLLYEAEKANSSLLTYDLPVCFMFLIAGLWKCWIVTRKIRQIYPTVSYTRCHIFTVVTVPLFSAFAMATFFTYGIVVWFNSHDNVLHRLVLALASPTLALLPAAICRHMALWRSSEIIEPGRRFVLVYFVRGAFITLYRVMQADFGNIWLFAVLSFLSSLAGFLRTATDRIRSKFWARIIKFLNKTCCSGLHHLPGDTPHHRRFKADIEIQNLLFENISIILSQSYILVYVITNFQLSDWSVVKTSLTRIAISWGFEFVFNILSTFVRIHWYDIPVARVWSKFWKRHLFANGIIVAIFVCYFTNPLLSVFQNRFHDKSMAGNYTIRNCTLPYESWR